MGDRRRRVRTEILGTPLTMPAHRPAFGQPVRYPESVAYLPPHEATAVPGFHAYSQRWSVAPGDDLDLRVSHDGPVRLVMVRHGLQTTMPEVVADLGEFDAAPHPIQRGSLVVVPDPVALIGAITVELWCRPLAHAPLAGLLWHPACQLALHDGRPGLTLRTSAGEVTGHGPALATRQWHHLAFTYDGLRAILWVNGIAVFSEISGGRPAVGAQAMRLGALVNEAGQSCACFTGDLWSPALYTRPLSLQELAARACTRPAAPAPGCVGHWVFDAVGGPPYRDTSLSERHGQGVNGPIRLIPGPNRSEDSDWCSYDPLVDPAFGHAVRLMADALVDCRWPVTATWTVPAGLASGQYAAQIRNAAGEQRLVHVIVRPPPRLSRRRSARQPRLVCLSTTSTRCAYNFQPFGQRALDYGAYQSHASYPLLGQLLGWRRPATGEPWSTTTVNFELPFYAWLRREGIAHEVYAEWDLEADPSLLDGATIVAWAGHSEYWTAGQYDTLRRFRQRGGHLLALSGNTAFWRVSVALREGLMEVRKHDRRAMPGVACDAMLNRAHHHQLDHLPGGYLHAAGWPQAALGLGQSNGFTDPPLNGPRADFEVLLPAHPLFQQPRVINTAGAFAPRAAGYETDLSLHSQLSRFGEPRLTHYPARDGSPPPSLAYAASLATQVLARARIPASGILDYDVNYFPGEMWAEMLYTPPGAAGPRSGGVFAGGSVLASEILLTDANFSAFLRNVLDHFGGVSGE